MKKMILFLTLFTAQAMACNIQMASDAAKVQINEVTKKNGGTAYKIGTGWGDGNTLTVLFTFETAHGSYVGTAYVSMSTCSVNEGYALLPDVATPVN